jgi:hypothetical protein
MIVGISCIVSRETIKHVIDRICGERVGVSKKKSKRRDRRITVDTGHEWE